MSALTIFVIIVLAVYSVLDFYKSAFTLSTRMLVGRVIGLVAACGFSMLVFGVSAGLVAGFAAYVLAVRVGKRLVTIIGDTIKRIILRKVADVDKSEDDA